ncbi:MAG TPA: hypothetical protein VFV23_03270 [Verrucomicrobiae bacterium]|nr:hypothetical protein [Verrucomicrobiae bacterium]
MKLAEQVRKAAGERSRDAQKLAREESEKTMEEIQVRATNVGVVLESILRESSAHCRWSWPN